MELCLLKALEHVTRELIPFVEGESRRNCRQIILLLKKKKTFSVALFAATA